MPCSKKLFLTGGTGLIGKELLAPLTEAGFEVYALTIEDNNPELPNIHWVKGNLFDEGFISAQLAQIKPEYLLNMAWCASGDYLSSNLNFDFLKAGLSLLKHFALNGGKRAVFAGTCFEYAFKDTPIKETDLIEPKSNYALCKQNLYQLASAFCKQNNISFACGRIFYVYGRGEHPSRLTQSVINNLKSGKSVTINHAQLAKDYMYTKDIAAAFTALTLSNVEGAVNICTGKGISLREYVGKIAKILGREDLLDLQQLPTPQPLKIVGDTEKLNKEVGFMPKYTLEQALQEILGEKK